MKNLFSPKKLSPVRMLCRQIAILAVGTCFAMSTHAAVNDLRVDSLITQAIQTHPLVWSARANQQSTIEGINAAKLSLLPTPSVSSGYDRDNDFVSQVTVRQPLWTAGKLTADVN